MLLVELRLVLLPTLLLLVLLVHAVSRSATQFRLVVVWVLADGKQSKCVPTGSAASSLALTVKPWLNSISGWGGVSWEGRQLQTGGRGEAVQSSAEQGGEEEGHRQIGDGGRGRVGRGARTVAGLPALNSADAAADAEVRNNAD